MKDKAAALLILFLLVSCQPLTGNPIPSTPGASPPPTQTEQASTDPTEPIDFLPSIYSFIHIAYTAQDQLWLWGNGEAIPLTSANPDTPLAFSADGDQIAFIRDGELLIIDSDGTDERVLISSQEMASLVPQNPAQLIRFSWVPGKPLLLVSTLNDSGIGLQPNQDLYLLDADTGEIMFIFTAGQGGITYPSPDGDWLVVVSQEHVILMKSDGSEQRTALSYAPYQSGYFPYIPKPYWGGDSRSLLLEVRTEAAATVWRIPVEGAPSPAFEMISARGLSFSPDLSRFAYVLDDGMLDSPIELHIADSDGMNDMAYVRTTHEDYTSLGFLGWAPDSQSFLFTDTDGNINLMKVGESEAQAVRIPSIEPFRAMKIVWLDADQFVIIIRSPSGIWLSLPGEQNLQIAGFTEGELVASDLARSFDVVIINYFLP